MNIPDKAVVKTRKETYKKGDKVRFIAFCEPDPYSKLTSGMTGVVSHVDDMGTVFCRWGNGEGIGLLTEDKMEKIKEDIL